MHPLIIRAIRSTTVSFVFASKRNGGFSATQQKYSGRVIEVAIK